jgi:hypothetical protein
VGRGANLGCACALIRRLQILNHRQTMRRGEEIGGAEGGWGMRCLRAEGEPTAAGRRGAGFGEEEEAAAEEEREGSRPDCLGF